MKTSPAKASAATTNRTSPFPVIADEVSLSTLRPSRGLLSRAWEWMQARQLARSDTRRLRVAETVSLGEKRFVAVVQVDGRHFLLAGGPTNIALLAQLDDKEPFANVLRKTMTPPGKAAKRKKPAKSSGHPGGIRVAPANPSVMSHFSGTDGFGDVLQKSMTGDAQQPAKPVRKQNARSTTGPTEHYA